MATADAYDIFVDGVTLNLNGNNMFWVSVMASSQIILCMFLI